jgi:transposase
MNVEVYKEWFLEVLDHLEEPLIIIMHNGSYHSTLAENYSKSNSRKSDVQKWLEDKNIPYNNLETLAELKMKVKNMMPHNKSYLIDELALERGHEVIRLPPYHCRYNVIELIWAQVKNEVA